MQTFDSKLLIYVLIIAAFLLFNYVTQQFAKRAREQQEAAAQEALTEPAEEEMPENAWGWGPAAAPPAPEPEPAPAAMLVPVPPAGAAARRLFRTRQDLRQAIVLMTVLGPCRALEPHEHR